MFPNQLQRRLRSYTFDRLEVIAAEEYAEVDELLLRVSEYTENTNRSYLKDNVNSKRVYKAE